MKQNLSSKPRALLCFVLSVLWIFPSMGALWILSLPATWRDQTTWLAKFQAFPLEKWIALALLAGHALLIYLAFYRLRHDPPEIRDKPALETN